MSPLDRLPAPLKVVALLTVYDDIEVAGMNRLTGPRERNPA